MSLPNELVCAVTVADVSTGARNMLLYLWSFAKNDEARGQTATVWPSVGTITDAVRCDVRTYRRYILELEKVGLARRVQLPRGSKPRLRYELTNPVVAQADVADSSVRCESTGNQAAARTVRPRGRIRPRDPLGTQFKNSDVDVSASVSGSGTGVAHDDGDDADRIWHEYETYRVRSLECYGAKPARGGAAPQSLRDLHARLGGDPADAWTRIANYGRDAVAFAAEAGVEPTMRTKLVNWRADGGEWGFARLEGVEERKGRRRKLSGARRASAAADRYDSQTEDAAAIAAGRDRPACDAPIPAAELVDAFLANLRLPPWPKPAEEAPP